MKLTSRSTILDFLKADGSLMFQNGAEISGDSSENSIRLANGDCYGFEALDDDGLGLALSNDHLFPDHYSDCYFDDEDDESEYSDPYFDDPDESSDLSSDSTLLEFLTLGGELSFSNGAFLSGNDDRIDYRDEQNNFISFDHLDSLDSVLSKSELFSEHERLTNK